MRYIADVYDGIVYEELLWVDECHCSQMGNMKRLIVIDPAFLVLYEQRYDMIEGP